MNLARLFYFSWNLLPGFVQITASKVYSSIYSTRLSRLAIKPFCRMNSLSPGYLEKFEPPTGQATYASFQDFFTRRLKARPVDRHEMIWPSEGYVCEQGRVRDLPCVKVKGQAKTLKEVFDETGSLVPDDYYYTNIFLHNHNYHRIHAPVAGQITRINRIPGELSILRPWFYKKSDFSKPALKNERVNVDIRDKNGRTWFLSIVGGMGVGTILLMQGIFSGADVDAGDEIGLFLLGSTCCIASPIQPKEKKYLEPVSVGDSLRG